eukprot:m.1265957 g.1265957  ORF g.1265957 m.1265957 type:complete len:1447 (+) comp24739_c0_seq3:359-4699(+)
MSSVDTSRFRVQSNADTGAGGQSTTLGTNSIVAEYSNGTRMRLQFGFDDINAVKRQTELAVGEQSCFLAVASGAVKDMAGNNITAQGTPTAIAATNFTADVSAPQYTRFTSINLTSGSVFLEFDEPVDIQTVNMSRVALQDRTGTVSISLARSVAVTTTSDYEVNIALDVLDLNDVKERQSVCTTEDGIDCVLNLGSNFIRDMVGLGMLQERHQALNVELDTLPPVLLAWELNMTSEELILTFDEPVNASTLTTNTKYFYRSDAQDSRAPLLHLVGGSGFSVNPTTVSYPLTSTDADNIKLISAQTNASLEDLGLRLQSGAIRDMNGIANTAVDVGSGLIYRDTVPPRLVTFAVDMNASTLTFNFNEPVDALSVNPSAITLLGASNRDIYNVVLSGGRILSDSGRQIILELSFDDVQRIKSNEYLLDSINTSFIAVSEHFVNDTSGNAVQAILTEFAVQASAYQSDNVASGLVSFGLDMNSELLTLTFGEVMNMSTFDPTHIILQTSSAAAPSAQYQLQGSSFNASLDAVTVELKLLHADANALRELGVGDSASTTYITLSAGTIQDMSGVNVIPVINGINSKRIDPSLLPPDVTAPTVTSFDVDMDQNTITIRFSETVAANSFNVSLVTLQSSADGVSNQQTVALSDASVVTTTGDSDVIVVQLGSTDVERIQQASELLVSNGTGYLSVTSAVCTDTQGNALTAVPPSSALQIAVFSRDKTLPHVVAVDLAYVDNAAVLTLTFSEVVDTSSLSVTSLALQSDEIGSSSTGTYTLQSSVIVTNTNESVVMINISVSDTNAIKRIRGLAVDANSTFLTAGSGFVQDMAGLFSQGINESSGLAVRDFQADAVAPKLVSFSLNLTSETMAFHFDEVVAFESLNAASIVVQGAPCAADANNETHRLTSTEWTRREGNGDDIIQVLQLTTEDLNTLKGLSNIASRRNNTHVRIDDGLVKDSARVPNVLSAIPDCEAMGVGIYVADALRPTLTDWNINMNSGLVELFVSELVASDVNVTALRLHRQPSGGPYHVLSNECTVLQIIAGTPNTRISIQVADDDLAALKVLGIGYSADLAYLHASDTLANDMNGNSITESFLAGNTTSFVADSTAPRLKAFGLDLTAGTLTIRMVEPVLLHSLNVSKLTLLSGSQTLNTSMVTLSGANTVAETSLSRTLTIVLLRGDLNTLKGYPALAVSNATTHLSAGAGFVQDMAQNAAVGVSRTASLAASAYTADVKAPVLAEFRLDHQTERLQLEFDETIDIDSVNVTGFVLQDSMQASIAANGEAMYRYRLTGGTIIPETLTTFSIQLLKADLNTLKRLTGVATGNINTYLSFDDATVSDTSNNSVVGVSNGHAIMAASVTPETIRPNIVSFGVHMATTPDSSMSEGKRYTGPPLTLRLKFDETMDVSSLDLTKIVVQGRSTDGLQTKSHRLTGGTVRALQQGDEGYTNP